MFARALIPIFLLVGLATAETRTYLVYRRDNFPQDRYKIVLSPEEYKRFVDTGKKDIDEAGGQPFRITSYSINFDGKYATWVVSFRDEEERWHLDSMERQGYIVMLSSMDVVSVDYGPKGKILDLERNDLGRLPTDYYNIDISSGV